MSAAEQLAPSPPAAIGPGAVLVELHLRESVGKAPLFAGLKAMGFAAVTFAFVDKTPDKVLQKAPDSPAMRLRFVGRLTHAVTPTDTTLIHWDLSEPLVIDPYRAAPHLPGAPVVPFVLETGVLYETRFVSRVKARPTSEDVADALDEMGFDVRELIHLTHAEDALGNLSIWFGRVVWDGPMSVVTPNDPFYFEQLVKLGPDPDPPDEDSL